MQSRDIVHITPAEWRWVVLAGVGLVALAFVPLLWIALSGMSGGEWQFMGILHNYRDGATYLSKMVQGSEGAWLVHFQHTPEAHNGALIQIIYPLLGHVAQLTGMPSLALFHAARVVASLFMYMAIYLLAASVWTRLRARRIFFILASIGSGFGWLYVSLTGDTSSPDLTIPEIFPFYSSLVNVHFPLTIACLALLASIFMVAFRPGENQEPNVQNGGLAAALLSFMLGLLYPQSLVPIGIGLGIFVAVDWLNQRRVNMRTLRWWLVVIVPAVPLAAYYGAVLSYNPAMAEWNSQNVTSAPSPMVLLLGLGIPLVIAAPGIFRAIRHFEPDGDQFMLIWLLTVVVMIYLPTNVQRRFSVGMMVLVAYFATRSLEDFWFLYVSRRWRLRLFVVVIPLIVMSNVLLLIGNLAPAVGPFLERDYATAIAWIRANARSSDVILASPTVSLWMPGWAGTRVVYGHPFETLNAESRRQAVLDWYSDSSGDNCETALRGDSYSVRYVIVGPEEHELGQTACPDRLEEIIRFGSVGIYAP